MLMLQHQRLGAGHPKHCQKCIFNIFNCKEKKRKEKSKKFAAKFNKKKLSLHQIAGQVFYSQIRREVRRDLNNKFQSGTM